MGDNGEPSPRRLETPDRESSKRSDDARRSRSRRRRGDSEHRSYSRSPLRGRSFTLERDFLREREQQLHREKKRLRELEDEIRTKRSRLRSTERHKQKHCQSRSQRRERSINNVGEEHRLPVASSNTGAAAQFPTRFESPSFTTNDIANILNALKEPKTQLSTTGAPIQANSFHHKNILPDFDPSSKNQRIDIWLKKVNECATVYGWDDKTKIHFAMQKLQGLAKVWYESLNSILFTWVEWQEKLTKAFPCEQNYGQSLEEMLKRKSKYNESLDVYYYDKLALLNQCDIAGKRAVDCIIHGLSDRTLKSSALVLRCEHPDQLLRYLISNKETPQFADCISHRNKPVFNVNMSNASNDKTDSKTNPQTDGIFCFNCKEAGHSYLRCSKPLVRCTQCYRVGHKTENCRGKVEGQNNIQPYKENHVHF